MKKVALLAAFATLGLSAGAQAQSTIVRADLTGPSGTIWTTGQTGNYTLFIRDSNVGPFFNTNDEPVNIGLSSQGQNNFFLNGEGFRPGETQNSDALYTLFLTLSDGGFLTGNYNSVTNAFLGGTSATSGNVTYNLMEFSFQRTLGDVVRPNVGTPGGDSADYAGSFNVTASSVAGLVPEPATWAMMIIGFGFVGGSLRRRNKISTSVRFA